MIRFKRPVKLGAVLVALVTLSMLFVAQTRFIARDEGFYLYAAKLILAGDRPYRDFFLPQMPLMPYLYAAWFWLVGVSWVHARVLAALIGAGCAVILYLCAKHVYGERSARISLVLLACSAAVQVWLPLAKNTGLASFFFLLTLYLSLVRQQHTLAGLCMGLSVLSRLTFAPLALLLFIPKDAKFFFPQAFRVFLGFAPTLLLLGWFYSLSPENFWDHNVTYHLQRTRLDEEGIAENKKHIFLALIGLKYCMGGGGRQFAALLLLASLSLLVKPRLRFEHLMLMSAAALFFVVQFIPSPSYVQYFFVVAMVTIQPAGYVLARIGDWIQSRSGVVGASVVLVALAVIAYACLGSLDFYRYLHSGEKVIGVGRLHHAAWKLHVASEVAQSIDLNNINWKPVYASWPGYLLEAKSRALPGTENNFGVGWANNKAITSEHAVARRVLGRDGIAKAFHDGTIDTVTLFVGRGKRSTLEERLAKTNARRFYLRRGIEMYVREP